jgi:hypothetical protein
MYSCPHGASTNCETCRKLAHIAALTYSPLTHQHMRETLAKLELENIMLKARIAELEQRLLVEETHGEKYRARIALLEEQLNSPVTKSEWQEQQARIAELEAVAEAAVQAVTNKHGIWKGQTLPQALRAAGYLKDA